MPDEQVGADRSGNPGASRRNARPRRAAGSSSLGGSRLLEWVVDQVAEPRGETVPLVRSPWSETDRPWRGVVLAFLGGGLTLLVGFTVTPSLFAFDVAQRAQLMGLVIIALALTAISVPRQSPLIGAAIVVAGVISFPMALGGLVAGSVLAVLGGALVAAWAEPPRTAERKIVPATCWRRLGAFLVDLLLLVAISAPLIAAVGKVGRHPALYIIPFTVWVLVTSWCTTRYGWTPGKILCALRISDDRTGAPPGVRVAMVRQVALLIAMVVAVEVATLIGRLVLGAHGEVNVIGLGLVLGPLAVAGLLFVGRQRLPHDRLLHTEVLAQRIVVPATRRAVAGRPRRAG